MARQTKTPAQRAQEALDVAQRNVTRLEARRATAEKELAAVKAELEPAKRRRDYLAQNPDLPQPKRTTAPREVPEPAGS